MAKIDFKQMRTAQDVQLSRLAQARQEAVDAVLAAVETALARHIGQVPLAEMLSWGGKELAARGLLSARGSVPDAQLLAEAALTGETVADLAQRIVDNADAQRATVSALTGLRRKALAGIAAAEDPPTIAAVLAEAGARIAAV